MVTDYPSNLDHGRLTAELIKTGATKPKRRSRVSEGTFMRWNNAWESTEVAVLLRVRDLNSAVASYEECV